MSEMTYPHRYISRMDADVCLSVLAPLHRDRMETIRDLCFGGCGIQAVQYIGVLKRLKELFGLDFSLDRLPDGSRRLQRCYGCSSGSIFALGLAIGLGLEEMDELVSELFDHVYRATPSYAALLVRPGAMSNRPVMELILRLLRKKIPRGYRADRFNFRDLYEVFGVRFGCTISVLGECEVTYLDDQTYWDIPVYYGICMSMCVPLVFPAMDFDGGLAVDAGFVEILPFQRVRASKCLSCMVYRDPSRLYMKTFRETSESLGMVYGLLYTHFASYTLFAWDSIPRKMRETMVLCDVYPHFDGAPMGTADLSKVTRVHFDEGMDRGRSSLDSWFLVPRFGIRKIRLNVAQNRLRNSQVYVAAALVVGGMIVTFVNALFLREWNTIEEQNHECCFFGFDDSKSESADSHGRNSCLVPDVAACTECGDND